MLMLKLSIYDLAKCQDIIWVFQIKQTIDIVSMENNLLEDILNVLVNVKLEMQRLKKQSFQDLLKKIDGCISRLAPIVDVYGNNLGKLAPNNEKDANLRDRTISHKQLSSFERNFDINRTSLEQQEEELMKVKRSFIKKEAQPSTITIQKSKNEKVIDYFMFKYDFKLKQYIILGRNGGQKSDRKVFLDLFTQDKSSYDIRKLQKTQSMTSIFKSIYTPGKVSQPFILPNFQEEQAKYLFVFGIQECGAFGKDFFKTQTLYCFVTREFLLGKLSHLMDSIAKICFEKRVSEISTKQDSNIHQTIQNINAKKNYKVIQEIIEEFLKNYNDSQEVPDLTLTRFQKWKQNTLQRYLERSSLRWSLIKSQKSKKQNTYFLSLVLLFYFAIIEFKVIMISRSENKHLISQLIIGLANAISPLTFVYPIVTSTITPHHMEFTNSPVPLLIGLWGPQNYCELAKNSLKRLLSGQKDLSERQLKRQTILVFFDMEQHSINTLECYNKETINIVTKLQNHLQIRYNGTLSQRLSQFLNLQLLSNDKCQDWIKDLRSKLCETQMYQFYTNSIRLSRSMT